MEGLLHYIWANRIFPATEMRTTDGRLLEVLDVGQHNRNQGSDFFNAKISLDGTLWVGNVEIHEKSGDWFRHGHDRDAAYDNTVLHVIAVDDAQRYDELRRTMDYPRLSSSGARVGTAEDACLDGCAPGGATDGAQRKVLGRVERFRGDWERATFVTLARTFGFGLNGDAFERWAEHVPLQAVGKHRDHLEQVAAIFLGMAGLLERCPSNTAASQLTPEVLQREWRFLSAKFQLSETMSPSVWRHMRIRPQNFPEVRILHLARLFHEDRCSLHRFLEVDDVSAFAGTLRPCGITEATCRLLVINTVVPVLYAYGIQHRDEGLRDKAIAFLEALPTEENYIMRQWKACGLSVSSAADSQALIQLKREYCDRRRCLHCRFGHEFLSVKA